VPKVHNKPIQSQKKGFKTKEQSKPKAALVWRTGLSGAPPGSVRCTMEDLLKLASLGTVRCASGATATSRQRSRASAQ
jgi:adenylylsulfate kinase-like enzyme